MHLPTDPRRQPDDKPLDLSELSLSAAASEIPPLPPAGPVIEKITITPDKASPIALELKGITPAELLEIFDQQAFPFDADAVQYLSDVLYSRKTMAIPELEKLTVPGVLVAVNSNRDYKVGGGKFSEERSISVSTEGDLGSFPYVVYNLSKSEPNKTGNKLDVKLTWDLEMMMGLALEDTRWTACKQALSAIKAAEVPDVMEIVKTDGKVDPSVPLDARASMKVTPFELRDMSESEIAEAVREAKGRTRIESLSWAPCAVHLEAPARADQLEALKAFGLEKFAALQSGGLLDEAMDFATGNDIQDRDVLWQLYNLPEPINIREKTYFSIGNPGFEREADEPQEQDDGEGEFGGETDGPDFGDEMGIGDLPPVQQINITNLPALPRGVEMIVHGALVPEDAEGVAPEDQKPYISLDWDVTDLSKAEVKEIWAGIKRLNSAIGGADMLDDLARRLPQDPYASGVTFTLDKLAVTFTLKRSEPAPEKQ